MGKGQVAPLPLINGVEQREKRLVNWGFGEIATLTGAYKYSIIHKWNGHSCDIINLKPQLRHISHSQSQTNHSPLFNEEKKFFVEICTILPSRPLFFPSCELFYSLPSLSNQARAYFT
jgi:hypothetical protein